MREKKLRIKYKNPPGLKKLYLKIIPSVIEALILIIPMLNFIDIFYLNIDSRLKDAMTMPYLGSRGVTLDFFVFFLLFGISNYVLLFSREFFLTSFSFITTLVSSCLVLYRFNELFSIKLYFLTVLIITTGLRFRIKKALILMVFASAVFTCSLFYPSVLGIVETPDFFRKINGKTFISYSLIILVVSFFSIVYRQLIISLAESLAVNVHLNLSMSQLTDFNQKLQDYAKNRGGEAAQAERLRITRDLHDSCGYVFVNIICLMEACCSAKEMEWSRVKETFETVRNLSSHGLQETRKTLRTIREIQNPIDTGLDSINEIRKIFQSVTKIKVVLDKGNMKSDYGPAVNKVLIRAMQEGLTNSVRHGMASEVIVNFRDDVNYLFMTMEDNGIGSKQILKGIGLAGMEERLKRLGGELKTYSGSEGGFKLEIKIPIIESMMEEYEKTKADAC